MSPGSTSYKRIRLGQPQVVRRFSEAEDDLLTRMRIEGHGTVHIARELAEAGFPARTQATINMRLKSLAARDERAEGW